MRYNAGGERRNWSNGGREGEKANGKYRRQMILPREVFGVVFI